MCEQGWVLTIHHELPIAPSHRFQTDIRECPRLISANHRIDIGQKIGSRWGSVGPPSRAEAKDAVKVRRETLHVVLQTV